MRCYLLSLQLALFVLADVGHADLLAKLGEDSEIKPLQLSKILMKNIFNLVFNCLKNNYLSSTVFILSLVSSMVVSLSFMTDSMALMVGSNVSSSSLILSSCFWSAAIFLTVLSRSFSEYFKRVFRPLTWNNILKGLTSVVFSKLTGWICVRLKIYFLKQTQSIWNRNKL